MPGILGYARRCTRETGSASDLASRCPCPRARAGAAQKEITPQQCRLRDATYAAPITVDIEYTRGKVGQGANCWEGMHGNVQGKMEQQVWKTRC